MRRATMSQRALIDINLLRDLLYILKDSLCADALDMLPYGNEIYIISKPSIARLYRTRIACISIKEAII